jgi:hypothetical protein
MHYFISKSNFLRVAKEFKINEEINSTRLFTKDIKFFSKVEENQIMSIKQFLIHSKNDLISFSGSGYINDSYNFINEVSHYAKYHLDENCTGLTSVYKDLDIPIEIKYKNGSEIIDIKRIEEFRRWFKSEGIEHLYYNDQQKFIDKLQLKFNLTNPPKPIELHGCGIQKISNYSEKELEIKINELINMASNFYNKSKKHRDILVTANFSRMTYYVTSKNYIGKPIERNNTEYTDDEIRELLVEFYRTIKKPIINYLIDYWIIKLNPNLNFNKNILEQLDFMPCKSCMSKKTQYVENEDVDDYEPLPF